MCFNRPSVCAEGLAKNRGYRIAHRQRCCVPKTCRAKDFIRQYRVDSAVSRGFEIPGAGHHHFIRVQMPRVAGGSGRK